MIHDFLTKNFIKYHDRPFIGSRKANNDQFQWSTYQEIYTKSLHLASYLSKNVPKQPENSTTFPTVCICSDNREEWMISDFACGLNGIVSVGYHSSWPLEESITISGDVNATVAIVGSQQLDYFLKISEKHKQLKLIISMDDIDTNINTSTKESTSTDENKSSNVKIVCLSSIYKMEVESFEPLPNEYHTIVYSSGTTGSPKGLPIKRQKWLFDAQYGPFERDSTPVCMSFSHLAHAMDRGIIWQVFMKGGKVAFVREDSDELLQDAQLIRPTFLMSMPYLWNDLYQRYKHHVRSLVTDYLINVEHSNKPSENLIDLLLSCCEARMPSPIVSSTMQKAKEDTRNLVGGRVKVIGTGGSTTSDQVLHFLRDVFDDAQVIDSYGTTEVPGISANGQISKYVTLRLVDCPEIGYVSHGDVREGEIVVKTDDMVDGYWGNREETKRTSAENFRDGWYYTQDIGRIDKDGKLTIIDRKSDLAELYVDGRSVWFPIGPLENVYLSSSSIVQNVYLHGDRMQSFLVAVVVPQKGKKVTKHDVFREFFATAKKNKLERSKIPRGVVISDHEWTPETGEVSPTNKLRRSVLLKKFKYQIDVEYGRINELDEKKAKIRSDKSFDYINYEFLCDDDENDKILNDIYRPIRESIQKMREMAPASRKKMDDLEKKVTCETDEVKSQCHSHIEELFEKVVDDATFSNFFNTLSSEKEKIKNACSQREDARYAGDPDVQEINDQIDSQIHNLCETADQIGVQLPFQITCGLVKLSPSQVRERGGNCLAESRAPSSWEVWCDGCGELIEIGAHGEGTPRYKCLDCDGCFCVRCHDMLKKLKELSSAHKKWKIPFECFAKDHYLSLENAKFLRTNLLDFEETKSLKKIFEKIVESYGSRILIDRNENSPQIVTYKEAAETIDASENALIANIRKDIERNDQEVVRGMFVKRIDDWPVVVHVKKDEYDSLTTWNAMFNGGRLVID